MISEQVTESGELVNVWDDMARTVTDYTTDPPTMRPYTAEENAAADAAAAAQADAAAQVDRFAAVESAVLATVDRTPKPWRPVTGAHHAGRLGPPPLVPALWTPQG